MTGQKRKRGQGHKLPVNDDPDGERDMALFKGQRLIHEIVTSVSYVDNIVWAATYFGDSRYDGRYWHNFLTKGSGHG